MDDGGPRQRDEAARRGRSAGLSGDEARERLRADGPNRLPPPPGPHPVRELLRQMVHFFAVMLWCAAGLAWLGGMPVLAAAIATVVLLNGVFSFVQEHAADQAAARLRDMLPLRATVRRDGATMQVDASELVVGDLVVLTAGDRVCADVEVIDTSEVAVDESLLTGESRPARHGRGERVLAGTYVVQGRTEAEVVAVAGGTRIAEIAAVMERAARPRSPLTRALHRVIRVVATVALCLGAGAFLVSLVLGRPPGESYLFAIGVTVALVPEGLLPTVTLSLSRAAQRMAHRHALVRRLDAVGTLGCTTYICTDKTGTLTQNQMSVVQAWTPAGPVGLHGTGYAPTAEVHGEPAAVAAARRAASSAARCVPDAGTTFQGGRWTAVGDPMDAALQVLAGRLGVPERPRADEHTPFDPRLRRSSAWDADGLHVLGAPDAVLPLCAPCPGAESALDQLAGAGLRVVAVACRPPYAGTEPGGHPVPSAAAGSLTLLALLALSDPPRDDVAEAVALVRQAGIRLAMVTGDHPATAVAVAREVGLVGDSPTVVSGTALPADDAVLGALLDRDEVVVARVAPEDKLRIARVLQERGHVVAMTGDGVNDGPALRAADIGIAMGASGSDVAREAADIVLLDDHFGSIVAAVELGRSTFGNIRRFLTYHLTDNVAELAPFVVWALSGGRIPLAITVLQVLALDIGTDLLPALALGAEPPNRRSMQGRRLETLVDRTVLRRAFGVLGPTEAAVSVGAFLVVLTAGGWALGGAVSSSLLSEASGVAFSAIVLAQLANAYACRSESRWVGVTGVRGNPLLAWAVVVELVLLGAFLVVPPLPALLGGTFPGFGGWLLAATAVPAVLAADTTDKAFRARRRTAVPPRVAVVAGVSAGIPPVPRHV
ncbi:cation-transporting P-type ATPase [Cellulomonas sp.]|uniref:cation-translocating P-type ATPase n=1 Tax=Cellulomonas sp. TaxID=40001 RepID=UPI0025C31247|nr:cation-transporting P-type ATPase [Cellulomonas sp.]